MAPSPIAPLVVAITTGIGALVTTLTGAGVGIHGAIQAERAHAGIDKALDELDKMAKIKPYRHPDDKNGDGYLEGEDCDEYLAERFGVNWRETQADKVREISHMCHDHWRGREGRRAFRDRRSVEEGREYTAEELSDIFSIPLPSPTPTPTKKDSQDERQSPPIIIVSRSSPRQEEEEEDEQRHAGSKIPPFLTNLCSHVSKDKTVSLIVLVGVVVIAGVEFLALVFCLAGWRTGCKKCWSKCAQIRGSSPLV